MLSEEKKLKVYEKGKIRLNPCSNGMLSEDIALVMKGKKPGLNPCSNGMLSEVLEVTIAKFVRSLNPCSNGMLSEESYLLCF